ncbi:GW dipeptide domain-containing protein [Lacticaseibacillus songhuajiangensis]|uniref:GW dipeptide domain-containing protein n=1 Tax=Lacticaseibacillus songhuajiangensis TaxID=1296539 RepID=UPI000F789275|nr:GW dipeptide domain-containing protein [Lacticaseibacillus songhuajiangensis]
MISKSRLRTGLFALLASITIGVAIGAANTTHGGQTVQAAKAYSKATNQYVTVKKSGYAFWKTFGFKTKLHDSKNYLQRTLQVKRIYGRKDGSKYYSVYRGGKWYGYLNAKAVANTKYAYGAAVKPGKTLYVGGTVLNKQRFHHESGWMDMNFKKKVFINLTSLPFTYTVKEIYYHSNGATYYKLYFRNQFYGYLNASQTKKTDYMGLGTLVFPGKHVITAGDDGANDKDDYIYNRSLKRIGKMAKGTNYLMKNGYYPAQGAPMVSLYTSNGKKFLGYAQHSF